MIRATFAAVLMVALTVATGISQPPPDPCEQPVVELKDLLAENVELDGNEFYVPVYYNGQGHPRVVILDGKNAASVIAAAPTNPVGGISPTWLRAAHFKGIANRQVIIFADMNGKTTGGVKATIINNKY